MKELQDLLDGLRAEIEALKLKVAALEARPWTYPVAVPYYYPVHPYQPAPYYPTWISPQPQWTYMGGIGTGQTTNAVGYLANN